MCIVKTYVFCSGQVNYMLGPRLGEDIREIPQCLKSLLGSDFLCLTWSLWDLPWTCDVALQRSRPNSCRASILLLDMFGMFLFWDHCE